MIDCVHSVVKEVVAQCCFDFEFLFSALSGRCQCWFQGSIRSGVIHLSGKAVCVEVDQNGVFSRSHYIINYDDPDFVAKLRSWLTDNSGE